MYTYKPPKIPTNEELLKTKTLYHQRKKDPIWITLEAEMQANANKKPYNEKVGKWLKFLRSLIYHYYCTEKNKYYKMLKNTGPPWFIEFSADQIVTLNEFKGAMHQDIMEKKTYRTSKQMKCLGMTLKIQDSMILEAMLHSTEDTGIFFWNLYHLYYKISPTQLLPKYDENAMIMMSALVYVDLDACKKEILRITQKKPAPAPAPPREPKKYYEPKGPFGQYLQRIYVPCYSTHPKSIPKPKKPLAMKNKVKLRTAESYIKLAQSESFLEIRRERNRQEKLKERKCNYKFWKPPRSLRAKNKALTAYHQKLKMFKKKPKVNHMLNKESFDNIQYYVKGVVYAAGKPHYQLECIVNTSTGYIPINGGDIAQANGTVLNILGYYRYPRSESEPCDSSCDCMEKWDKTVREYLAYSKCECRHPYDLSTDSKSQKKYFNPPKDGVPFWIDEALVYQADDWQEFVREQFADAMISTVGSVPSSTATIPPTKLKEKDLLSAFLADLAHSPLIIPHLPQANLLKNLQAFVRTNVKGGLCKEVHKNLLLKTKRQWLDLEHITFAERAYLIRFTEKQLAKLKFCHRPQIQELSLKLLEDFEKRTRKSWLEHSRLFWTTMMNDIYPSNRFLDTFFTYMPARLKDTHVVEPFSPSRTPRNVGRTCSLPKTLFL